MQRKSQSGIVMVAALMLTSVSLMLVGAGLSTGQFGLKLAESDRDELEAEEAARAGVAYAKSRLQENPAWTGGANDEVTVNMPGQLYVRENRGNVVGLLGLGGERPRSFFIRFNHHNGAAMPEDGYALNPAPEMMFPIPWVSTNNLDSPLLKPVFRSQNGGGWMVSPASSTPFDASRYSCVILCEGRAGNALRGITTTQFYPPAGGNQRLARKVVECTIARDIDQLGDSPLYSAADSTIQLTTPLSRMKVESRDGGVPPRLRTLANISVEAGAGADLSPSGEVYVRSGTGSFRVNGIESVAPQARQENSNFPNVRWSQIPKASPADATAKAGTYVWRRSPRRLEYYPQTFDPAVGPPPASPPGLLIPDGDAFVGGTSGVVSMDKTRMLLRFSDNVYIEPQGTVTSIAVVAEENAIATTRNRPNFRLDSPSPTASGPILTGTGDIYLEGDVKGSGSITAEGNLTFQGASVIDASPNTNTLVYSRKDITLLPIPEAVVGSVPTGGGSGSGSGSGGGAVPPVIPFLQGLPNPFGTPAFRDIAFGGLIYAQGRIHAPLAGTQTPDLYFRGMVVAYGGNPEAGESAGADATSGQFAVNAKNLHLVYDSSVFRSVLGLTGPTPLRQVCWQTY